ncbi:NlpC/P60 family protein [Burkholderia pseudomallei]|uniref:NlpC/P60 family protein n=1 Tax=Burkholderia pseudomallei TaxID=28450 RepID=UPI0022EA6F31|nr:NlpC/P60 family protein [Burkholderia pseudomallei]
MVTRQQFVDETRTWLGTPYRHQGRLKGVAVDCAGLVIGVAKALGLCPSDYDVDGYSRRPDGTLAPICDSMMDRTPVGREGDVVLFHWEREPMHLGILTAPRTVIHAYAVNRVVCEHDMDDKWLRYVCRYYSVKGVE